jgi:hypothetical protein
MVLLIIRPCIHPASWLASSPHVEILHSELSEATAHGLHNRTRAPPPLVRAVAPTRHTRTVPSETALQRRAGLVDFSPYSIRF